MVFQVDVSELSPAPGTVYVAGSHQGWNPGGSPMNDAGDGLWVLQTTVTGSDSIQFKYLSSPDWTDVEGVPADCGVDNGLGGFNRILGLEGALTTAPVVCFSSCSACDGSGGEDPGDPVDPVDGSAFCGPGTVWDDQLELCVGLVTCEEDIDGDGLVGVSDVLALLSEFGTVCP